MLALGRYDVGAYLWIEAALFAGGIVGAFVLFSLTCSPAARPWRRLLRLARIDRPIRTAYEGVHGYATHPGSSAGLFALTLAVQAFRVLAIWLVARSVGVDLSPRPFYVLGPLLFLVMLVPFTVNGLAIREAFFVSFLGKLHVAPDPAFATGFLFYLLSITSGIPGRDPAPRRADAAAAQGQERRDPNLSDVIEGKRIAVVIPAYNEEKLLETTLAGMPRVRRSGLSSSTMRHVTGRSAVRIPPRREDPRIVVIVHERNRGAGGAVVTGYQRAHRPTASTSSASMNGDNQMDPDELIDLVDAGRARRGRLHEGEPPLHRRGVEPDPALPVSRQRDALAPDEDRLRLLAHRRLPGRLHGDQPPHARAARPREHLPALRVSERHARPPERVVGTRPRHPVAADLRRSASSRASGFARSIPRISWLLMKGFFWRMGHRYVIRDFHPLVFFYTAGSSAS